MFPLNARNRVLSASSYSRPAAAGCASPTSHHPPLSAPPITAHSPSRTSSHVLPMPSPVSPLALSSPSFRGTRLESDMEDDGAATTPNHIHVVVRAVPTFAESKLPRRRGPKRK